MEPKSSKDIPIIINNFNRLAYLKRLIERLERDGYRNLHIIDNASTYPPLLEYYASCRYPVLRLHENLGYLALWRSPFWRKFRWSYYVYTDPDVVPDETCPGDYLEVFLMALRSNLLLDKVGFSLKIADLPDAYSRKNEVMAHESQFWKKKINGGFFEAPVDTTFALYRPFCGGGHELRAWRSAEPYVARHLPWYEDSSRPDAEQKYYAEKVAQPTHWSVDSRLKP